MNKIIFSLSFTDRETTLPLREIICHFNVKIVDEIPWCYHSNNTYLVELFHSSIYF